MKNETDSLTLSIHGIITDAMNNYHKEIERFLEQLTLDSMILDLPNHVTFVTGNPPEYLKEKAIKEFCLYVTMNNEKKLIDHQWLMWKKDLKTHCMDCGTETVPGTGSARCKECWEEKLGYPGRE